MAGYMDRLEGKIKEEWGDLTDQQVTELKGKFQKNLGLAKQKTQDAQEQLDRAWEKTKQEYSART